MLLYELQWDDTTASKSVRNFTCLPQYSSLSYCTCTWYYQLYILLQSYYSQNDYHVFAPSRRYGIHLLVYFTTVLNLLFSARQASYSISMNKVLPFRKVRLSDYLSLLISFLTILVQYDKSVTHTSTYISRNIECHSL